MPLARLTWRGRITRCVRRSTEADTPGYAIARALRGSRFSKKGPVPGIPEQGEIQTGNLVPLWRAAYGTQPTRISEEPRIYSLRSTKDMDIPAPIPAQPTRFLDQALYPVSWPKAPRNHGLW